MKRKIILVSCGTVMLAVIVIAVFLKNGELLKKLSVGPASARDSYSEQNGDKDGIDEYETSTYETRADDKELRVYDIGEDVICGAYDEGDSEDVDKKALSYRVNGVERVSRITNISDRDKYSMYLVKEDGTADDGYEFVAVDLTIKNDSDENVEYCLMNTTISEKASVSSAVNEPVYYSGYPGNIKSAFIRVLNGGEEYHTKVVYAVKKETAESGQNGLYYIINPTGGGYNTTGAAAIRIKLEGEPHETDI